MLLGGVVRCGFRVLSTHSSRSGHHHRTVPVLSGVKHVVAVASGKGGVGKSTCAVNLALGLSALGMRVGILDADIYGPSIPKLLHLNDLPQTQDDHMVPLHNYGLQCMSMGFLVPPDQATIWRGPMVMSALRQMLRQTLWGDLDVLVVDLPPGTGDVQLSLSQEVPLSGAVVISTPQDLALMDARRGIHMFRRISVPLIGLVENMSYFACPSCGHVEHIFGTAGARATAQEFEIPFLGEIPLHSSIRSSSDEGQPVVFCEAEESPQRMAFMEIATRVKDFLENVDRTGGQQEPSITME